MAVALAYDATSLLSTIACSLLICIVFFKWFRERNYPPGPWGLPLLGYGPYLGKTPHKTLRDLSKKYGDVFSFTIGPKLHICITDYHLAKDLLNRDVCLSRPPHSLDFMKGKGGIGGANGKEWQEQRRFAFYTMRNLGLGKGLWETMIQVSAGDFAEEIKSWKGKPTFVEGSLNFAQSSTNISLLIGRHFDKEKKADVEKQEFFRSSSRLLMEYFSAVAVNMSLPWLAKIMETFHLGGYHKFIKVLREFESIFRTEVEERLKSPESLTKDDFIGCYMREMAKKEKEGKNQDFNMDNLLGNLALLFIAGNDSSMAGISWMLLLMASYPEIQKKIHVEIDAALGRDGVVNYNIKSKLPYTMATLHEMLRFISISTIFAPRYVSETFTFNGYTMPQGCHVVTNMWSISRDPRYFRDPEEFQPKRFLDEKEEKILKLDGNAPFSIGKRNCPGEGTAIMSIFLHFVHIMQKFEVTMPPGVVADLEPISVGGAEMPKPQKLCLIER